MNEVSEVLHDIDTRLRIVESDLTRMANTRKWILAMAFGLIVQAVAGAVGYGELINKVESSSNVNYARDVSTALGVLKDHGSEFEAIRNEMARIRGNIDNLHIVDRDLAKRIEDKTRERFYHSDGLKLDKRITRLEDLIIKRRINRE